MKVLAILLVVVAVALVAEGAKTKEQNKPKCNKICTAIYAPVCASDGVNKPRSFGSACVLDAHNCENNANLKKISDGECPGGGGVRLS